MMKDLTLKGLQTAVHTALKSWHKLNNDTVNLLQDLLIVQEEHDHTNGDSPTTHRLAANSTLLKGLNQLKTQDSVSEQLLYTRFIDDVKMLKAALDMGMSKDQAKRKQQVAIRQLAQIIWERETAVRHARAQELLSQLPPAGYHQLFGAQEKLDELLALLRSPKPPWVVALVGIGGIGKSSLADAAIRALVSHFVYEKIVWLRVSPEEQEGAPEAVLNKLAAQLCPDLSASATVVKRDHSLRAALKATPHLVVIDNLETAVSLDTLVTKLNDFANPTQFILTSRVRLSTPGLVYNLPLDQLSSTVAVEFIRHLAHNSGLKELAQAPNDALLSIHAVTGGHPLAIKLVVGLADTLPLSQILGDLKAAHLTKVEGMYNHIYLKAWRSLSQNGQALLEMMRLSSEIGLKPELMQRMGDFDETALWSAISELVSRSLLEVRGTTWERRYGIHRLTESFLETEIVHDVGVGD